MAASLSSGACFVEEDQPIATEEMHKRLCEFMRKKTTQNGLSDDKYSTLERLKQALENEVDQNSDE